MAWSGSLGVPTSDPLSPSALPILPAEELRPNKQLGMVHSVSTKRVYLMNERVNELKVCSNGWVGVQPDPIVDTLRSTHSRKHPSLHPHSQGSQDFQAWPPIASARSIRTNLPQVTIVGGSKKRVSDAGTRHRSTLGFVVPSRPEQSLPSNPTQP